MAEMIPYGIVERVFARLGSLAFQEIAAIYGVNTEIEKLKDTVEFIRAVLLDAEQKQEQNHVVKIWIRRLKRVLHDADDLFDDIMIEEMRHEVHGHGSIVRKVSDFLSSSNPIVFRMKMSDKIKKIRQQFVDIKEDVSNLNLSQGVIVIRPGDNDRRETSSSVLESNIVGRDESKKEIINFLLHTETNQNVSLIALVGIGGLGKTALAQLVYNDAEVKNFFEKQMWVCVSEEFEVKTLVKRILEASTHCSVDGNLQLEVLKNKLQDNIKGKRYLLVLDDVWNDNQEKWNNLLSFLIHGAQGSKVLVTTRHQIVADTMNASTSYVLKGLTKEQSWTLLKKLAFGENETVNQSLASIGKEIAEKCGGVPLAIKSIGGLLLSKRRESEWLNILKGEFWELCNDDNGIMPVLKLSYNHLPIELRHCFVYCCLYPKDYKIYKDELIQLWMAEGYVECSNERQNEEDIGDQYVQILLKRSFFQDIELNINGDIKCFKMHDLIHDLARSVAGTDCYLHCEGKEMDKKPLHISFGAKVIPPLDVLVENKTRTIFWPGSDYFDRIGRSMQEPFAFSNLKCLRVLDLSESDMIELPKSIGKLKHLRYLDLSRCCKLKSLPKTISNLVNLQTLKLTRCESLEFSTKAIAKLINLRHLMINYCKAFKYKMPIGLGNLKSLQSLSTFYVGRDDGKRKSATLNELKELNNLGGKLVIETLDRVRDVDGETKDVNLKEKKYLWSLEFRWRGAEDENGVSVQVLETLQPPQNLKQLMLFGYTGVTISGWLLSLRNLVEIIFFYCRNCQRLPPMEHFPFLKVLAVKGMDALEYIEYEEILPKTMFFPSLKDLSIMDCQNLKGWHKKMGDGDNGTDVVENPHSLPLPLFPRLSYLFIEDCANLTCMPTFPHLIEELYLRSCNVKPLIETICSAKSSSSFTPLSKLKNMTISQMDIEGLPEEWVRNLTSLERLQISGVHIILRQLQHLAAVAPFQKFFVEGMDLGCQFPPCLPSLQNIEICNCKNLKPFLEWICNLPSLQYLEIRCCDLDLLPEGMTRLTNLYTLRINFCPLLFERCKRETGADWPKIAHIPRIIVDYQTT